jgi:hypothetical protein
MQLKFVVPVLASLAFAGPTALAQEAPQGPMHHRMQMSAEDMSKHHAEMCGDMYAKAVGGMAALEVKLKLTAAQKPLFERWKTVRLSSAKAHSDKCGTMKMPDRDMSIVDGLKLETTMLEARLADLRAETPSLEALVNALDKDQQETLKRAAIHAMHGRMEMMHGFMDRHEGMRGMHHMGDGNPPPPPPAN